VFSSALENLLANAEEKRATDRNLAVSVTLNAAAETVSLSVCDSGTPVPADIAARVLQAPVPSANGLGIGLFQATRLARAAGFALELRENRPGRVCFVLTGPAKSATAG
jgi:sensor histidine kinase regulating citrate/malate metabolism